eukprot:scaffold1166_cov261-Pinguiococcus_pyrenoidosus.AAC.61
MPTKRDADSAGRLWGAEKQMNSSVAFVYVPSVVITPLNRYLSWTSRASHPSCTDAAARISQYPVDTGYLMFSTLTQDFWGAVNIGERRRVRASASKHLQVV